MDVSWSRWSSETKRSFARSSVSETLIECAKLSGVQYVELVNESDVSSENFSATDGSTMSDPCTV